MYYNQREEIGGIKAAKEDLVHKNRELFGQLNGQIYNRASEYREKSIEILNRSHNSPRSNSRGERSTSGLGLNRQKSPLRAD